MRLRRASSAAAGFVAGAVSAVVVEPVEGPSMARRRLFVKCPDLRNGRPASRSSMRRCGQGTSRTPGRR